MIVPGFESKYLEYVSGNDARWAFGNEILYRMCREHPSHVQEDEVVGKIWLIGRSYAAAIERRKNADDQNDDFYYDVVAPQMLYIGKELDERLVTLKSANGNIRDNLPLVLGTHKFLMDAFYAMTGLEKRSLASKYLHFHCPMMFFIYDSRAKTSVHRFVKRPDKSLLPETNSCDAEYGDFVCRMLELQEYINEKLNVASSPRQLDSFLLR